MLKLSQTYTHKKLLQVKPLEISSTADAFASDSDEVHMVADEFGLAEELGVRQCELPTVRKLSALTN